MTQYSLNILIKFLIIFIFGCQLLLIMTISRKRSFNSISKVILLSRCYFQSWCGSTPCVSAPVEEILVLCEGVVCDQLKDLLVGGCAGQLAQPAPGVLDQLQGYWLIVNKTRVWVCD